MDKWFESTGIGLGSEHGCYYKHPVHLRQRAAELGHPKTPDAAEESDHWFRLVNQVDAAWRDVIRPLFQHYTERTPGSHIEEKEVC